MERFCKQGIRLKTENKQTKNSKKKPKKKTKSRLSFKKLPRLPGRDAYPKKGLLASRHAATSPDRRRSRPAPALEQAAAAGAEEAAARVCWDGGRACWLWPR